MTVVTMSRKRPRFKKIPDKGWDTIKELSDSPIALKIWIFITKHADMYNSLVAPVAVLAEECGCHTRTVRRATKLLEDRGFLVIVKIGTSNAYIVDAEALGDAQRVQEILLLHK